MLTITLLGCSSEGGPSARASCDDGLRINEIAAANEAYGLVNDELCASFDDVWCCNHPDWLELYNASDEEIDASGYSLSAVIDDPLQPLAPRGGLSMAPYSYLVVIMHPYIEESPDCAALLGYPFALGAIDLDRDGGTGVSLVSDRGEVCSEEAYPDQHADFSWSWQDEGPERVGWCDARPSPGEENNPCLCSEPNRC